MSEKIPDSTAGPTASGTQIDCDIAQVTARLRAEHKQETRPLQRALDCLTGIVGQPGFAAALTMAMILWVLGNSLSGLIGIKPLDPPPFPWLQGTITAGAFYVALLILTTQVRKEELSGLREQLLLELMILNDQKSSKIIALLEETRRDDPTIANRDDVEARTMSTPADHHLVVEAIKET